MKKKIKGLVIWLLLIIPISYLQFLMMVGPIMAGANGLTDASILANIFGLFIGVIVVLPLIGLFTIGIYLLKKGKMFKVPLVFNIIVIIILIDVVFAFTGGYSLSRFIIESNDKKKIELVELNHPSKNPTNIKIPTNVGEYYLTEEDDLLRVGEKSIDKLNKELDIKNLEGLYTGRLSKYFYVTIIDAYRDNYDDRSKENTPLRFKITGSNYIYSTLNSKLFQDLDGFKEFYINEKQLVKLEKQENTIKIDLESDFLKKLRIQKEMLRLEFINNGSFVFSVDSFSVDSLKIINGEYYINYPGSNISGDWSVQAKGYSSIFNTFIYISEKIYWKEE